MSDWAMRSMRLLVVAVLAVVLALPSAQNAFALPLITLNPTCGSPGTTGLLGATGTGALGAWSYSPTEPLLLGACLGGVADGTYFESCGFTVRTDVPPGLYTITYTDQTGSASVTFSIPCPAVGGAVVPVNTFAVLAPWLAVVGLVGCVATVVVLVVQKKREN